MAWGLSQGLIAAPSMNQLIAATLFLTTTIAGCALYGAEESGSDFPPPNSSWELVEIAGEDTRLIPDAGQLAGRAPDLRFGDTDPSGTRYEVSGYLGCNAFSATLRFTGTTLDIEELFHTEIACQPYPAGVENAYLEGLHATDRYSISGQTLTFHYAGGTLTFRRIP